MSLRPLCAALAACCTLALPAYAQQAQEIGQRQGQFKLYLHNFGVLGSMAQGRIDYDAAQAQIAADNMFHLTRHDQSRLWPEGTDSQSAEGTRAKPEIWANLDDFVAKFGALQDAAVTLQSEAGNGVDALRAAVGAMGGTCQACHQAYREES